MVVSLLLAAGILWRESEQQYVAMTNLALRLEVLQKSAAERQLGQLSWPSWEIVWKPMVTAMQFEARIATIRWRGYHLSRTMHEQLSRIAEAKIGDEADLKNLLAQLDFSGDAVEARLPLVFSERQQQYSLSTLTGFRDDIAARLSRETAYADWLMPILQQQQSLDKATTCRTLAEIKAFQTYTDRLQSRCVTDSKKWAVCAGKNEPITRQMKELQATLESNLKKFKSRWPTENVHDLCSDI
jgi:hypothetical protein